MKKLCLLILFIFSSMVIFIGCDNQYPDSALYVGENERYKTIQSAIDSCTFAGQYVVVSPGKYYENLTIDKPVKILGHYSRTVLIGKCTIKSSGIRFEHIVFDGKEKIEDGIVFDGLEDELAGFALEDCDIKNYNRFGIYSKQEGVKSISGITMIDCDFVGNKVCAIQLDNAKNIRFADCYFENNGIEEDGIGGVNFPLAKGKFGGIEFHNCDFRRNSNGQASNYGAVNISVSSDGEYDGEVIVDGCYFLENEGDIVSGQNGEKQVAISNINLQSWTCDIIYLESSN